MYNKSVYIFVFSAFFTRKNAPKTLDALFVDIKVFNNTELPLPVVKHERLFGAERCALAALNALIAVDSGRVEPVLAERADGAHLNSRAGMILRAVALD